VVFGFFFGSVILNVGLFAGFNQVWQLALISITIGFNYYAIPSVCIVYASQVAFPVDQASVAGYLFAISHTVGFGMGLAFIPFLN
jgi:hypothetical protein